MNIDVKEGPLVWRLDDGSYLVMEVEPGSCVRVTPAPAPQGVPLAWEVARLRDLASLLERCGK